jgi:HSP20 family protein
MNELSRRRNRDNSDFFAFGPTIFDDFDRVFRRPTRGMDQQFVEKDSHYLTSIDMPGVKNEDIEINVDDNMMTISAQRDSDYGRREYTTSFILPSNLADTDEIKAIYEDGVLKIALPKSQKEGTKKISLSNEDKDGFFEKLFSSRKEKNVDVEKKSKH